MPQILIIEDSTALSDALRTFFEWHGYHVSTAQSVKDGVESAVAKKPDILLLDLSLPDGHGLTVLHELQSRNLSLPATVALTGHEDNAMRDECLLAGCRQVLAKPVPTQTLLAVVQSL